VRGVAVGDLGDVAEAGLVEVGEERGEEAFAGLASGGGVVAADAHPCVDERADEPRPGGALMVAAVAAAAVAFVAAGVTGLVDTLTGEAVVLSLNGVVLEGRTATTNASSDPRACEASTRSACSCAATPGISDEPKSAATPSVAMTTQSPGASVVLTSLTLGSDQPRTPPNRVGESSESPRSRSARTRRPSTLPIPVQVRPAVSRSNQATVATTPRVERSAWWQWRSITSGGSPA